MQLADILQPDCVKVPLKAKEKFEAITELIDVLDKAGLISDYQTVYKSVMQRESVRSTGVGQGFAIPHGKCPAVEKLIMAVGKTETPIDFQSIDKQPVELIVLLVSPMGQPGPHIQALARISRLMTDPTKRKLIADSTTPEELFKHIIDVPA